MTPTIIRGVLAVLITAPVAIAYKLGNKKPIMGWNNCQIDCGPWAPDDQLVRETALLMNTSGLLAAGYNFQRCRKL